MTAAHRLKGVGWFGSCVVVVLAFYLVSLQVAAERNRLDAVNARVADAEHDIRALETEFDTRANLAQLERWNGDTLALTAPVAGQFVADETALASIDVTAGAAAAPDGSPIRTAALLVPSLTNVSLQTIAPTLPPSAPTAAIQTASVQVAAIEPAPIRAARVVQAAAPVRTIATTPKAQAAMYRAVAVANVRPQAVAMLDRKLLSDSTLGDILSGARAESGRRR
ncbi:hypothetical protein [Sphingomonas sp.]|uniref:hypothetical protein n=1 Tax=Sphingomonas sp. TaxID=28214 RepID=UPI0035BC52B3